MQIEVRQGKSGLHVYDVKIDAKWMNKRVLLINNNSSWYALNVFLYLDQTEPKYYTKKVYIYVNPSLTNTNSNHVQMKPRPRKLSRSTAIIWNIS